MSNEPEYHIVSRIPVDPRDKYGITRAVQISNTSPDPNTQIGAVVINSCGDVIGAGCNRFPDGISENARLYDRLRKNQIIVHAEVKAVMNAVRSGMMFGVGTHRLTLYMTSVPCSRCAGIILNAGIKRVVGLAPSRSMTERWGESMNLTRSLFAEAGVELIELEKQS